MRAIDTNVLVRLMARDDEDQVAVAEAFIAKGAWVSHVVLVETLWVLDSVYDVEPQRLIVAIEMLLNHQTLALEDANVVAAALEHFRAKPSMGFSDSLIVEIARKAGHLPLGTFDRALGRLDGAERLTKH
jgi:predicted nucleic-acid-binding protein